MDRALRLVFLIDICQKKGILTLKTALFFKIFERTQAISLYWFAVQQTSTFRRQTFGLFFLKFSAEFNELSLKF